MMPADSVFSSDGSITFTCVVCKGDTSDFCLDCGGSGKYVFVPDDEDCA